MHDLPRPRASARRADVLLIVGFLAILAYPSLALLRDPAEVGKEARVENRVLQPRPPIHRLISEPARFVAEFRAFLEDEFLGRPSLIAMNSRIRVLGLGVSTNPQVIVGKHGSLFYAGDPHVPTYDLGHEVAKQRRVRPLSEVRLAELHKYLLARKHWAESLGARFLMVLAPDKSTVYPEHAPDWMAPLDAPSVTDQALDYLASRGDVEFLDLRPAMFQAKAEHARQPLYYRYDTHWNFQGAFVGYEAITDRLHTLFPGGHSLRESDLSFAKIKRTGDLAWMLRLGDTLQERTFLVNVKEPRAKEVAYPYDTSPVGAGQHPPRMFQTGDASLPKGLILHDSYMDALMDFLAEDFQTSVFTWDLRVNPATLGDFKPDVVLYELVERSLPYLLLYQDGLTPPVDPRIAAEDAELSSRGRRR